MRWFDPMLDRLISGDTFMVKIHGEEHYLRATSVGTERQDKNAGCLIDTQVEVEFEEPIGKSRRSSFSPFLSLFLLFGRIDFCFLPLALNMSAEQRRLRR